MNLTDIPTIASSETPDSYAVEAFEVMEADFFSRVLDSKDFLTASERVAVLRAAGWKKNSVAVLAGRTRAAMQRWPKVTVEDVRPESEAATRPVMVLRPSPMWDALEAQPTSLDILDASMRVARPIIPDEMVKRMRLLARYAYLSRQSGNRHTYEMTRGIPVRAGGKVSDYNVAAALLDVLLSVYYRRGVSFYLMARHLGVTHRAIIARMERASWTNETFMGAEDVLVGSPTPGDWADRPYLPEEYRAVRLTENDRMRTAGRFYASEIVINRGDDLWEQWMGAGRRQIPTEFGWATFINEPRDPGQYYTLVANDVICFEGMDCGVTEWKDIWRGLPERARDIAALSETIVDLMRSPEKYEDIAPVIKKHGETSKTRRAS